MATALVTGPTSGIGLQFARTLAQRGHDLVLVSRDEARLQALAVDLRTEHGVGVEVIVADLSDRSALARVEARLRVGSTVDVLVNNAGFGIKASFARSDVEEEQRMLDVLVTAVMRLTHAALPQMLDRGRGRIVNVSSVASWIAGGTYSAAKAWVTVFSEGLNGDLAGTGVHVTAACPGFVHTEFHQRARMGTAGIPAFMWVPVTSVVDTALRDVDANRPLSVAGLQYKSLSAVLRTAPRALARRVGGRRSTVREGQ